MSTPDEVLDAIDSTLADWSVSRDAMRWTPEPPEEPGLGDADGQIAVRVYADAQPYIAAVATVIEGFQSVGQAAGEAFAGVTRMLGAGLYTESHQRSISAQELYWGQPYQTTDMRPADIAVPVAGAADAIIRWVDQHAENGRILEPWQRDFVRRMLRDHGPDLIFVGSKVEWPDLSGMKAEYRRRRTARQRRRRR